MLKVVSEVRRYPAFGIGIWSLGWLLISQVQAVLETTDSVKNLKLLKFSRQNDLTVLKWLKKAYLKWTAKNA